MKGGRGGCCTAWYGGGGSGGGERMYGMSKVDKIMLKFRPIAPKPAVDGSGSGGSVTENSDSYVKCVRSKRKYVRVKKNKIKKNDSKEKVTLSLLPETPDRKENLPVSGFSDLKKCNCSNSKKLAPAPVWLSFDNQEPPPVAMQRRPPVVSYVTVECVTDTCVDLEGLWLGCTDEERVMSLEKDTCPGFVTDGQDIVVWTNNAYRRMAGVGHVFGGDEMTVVLVWKDKWTPSPVTYPAFTCKVRVTTSASHSHRRTSSPSSQTLTLPCDVWRMERGGCAWRLDVKAALSLGR